MFTLKATLVTKNSWTVLKHNIYTLFQMKVDVDAN